MDLLSQDWLYVVITVFGFVMLYRAVQAFPRHRFAFLTAVALLAGGATAVAIGASRLLGLTEPMTLLVYVYGLDWNVARTIILAIVATGTLALWLDS